MKNKHLEDLETTISLLGSPQNIVNANFVEAERKGEAFGHRYYSDSQEAFANLSMETLISLISKPELSPDAIFNLDEDGITELEIENMEKLYQYICDERLSIAKQTNDNLPSYYDEDLSYSENVKTTPAKTELNKSKQYSKYCDNHQPSEQENKTLYLSGCSTILDSQEEKDTTIELGKNAQYREMTHHFLGNYKDRLHVVGEGTTRIVKTDNVHRVDAVTALAAKKSLQAALQGNEEESLKDAFIFGTLRGHNTRSDCGACWGMEMSMRWLFAHNQQQQFNVSPGTYLDIEAIYNLPCDNNSLPLNDPTNQINSDQAFAVYIDQMVNQYQAAQSNCASIEGSIFAQHAPATESERKLMTEKLIAANNQTPNSSLEPNDRKSKVFKARHRDIRGEATISLHK